MKYKCWTCKKETAKTFGEPGWFTVSGEPPLIIEFTEKSGKVSGKFLGFTPNSVFTNFAICSKECFKKYVNYLYEEFVGDVGTMTLTKEE